MEEYASRVNTVKPSSWRPVKPNTPNLLERLEEWGHYVTTGYVSKN